MRRFEGKVSIVTGSAQGIGKEIARKLGEEGAEIILIDLNEERLKQTYEEFKNLGFKVSFFKADISKKEDVESVVSEIEKKYNVIHNLVNNAGITRDNLLMRMSEEDWDLVLNVNLKGAFLMTKAVIRNMIKNRTGRIVNISSVVGLMGNAGQTNYSASKAGLIGFTRSLAREVASRGITVNAVAPGYIETEMTLKLPQEVKDAFLNIIPMKRFGKPEEIAEVVLFLLSDSASYITGEVISVNGGLFMG